MTDISRAISFVSELLRLQPRHGCISSSRSPSVDITENYAEAKSRRGGLCTIVTTSVRFENWTEVPGSERLTLAAVDRLTYRCHSLGTKGESYWLAEAKQRCRSRRQE